MDDLAQLIIAGLKSGAVYALVALGFALIHSATGAINFAQGEFFMLGGMLGAAFLGAGLPLAVAVVLAVACTALVGVAMERLAIRPLADGNPLRIVLVTIGCSVVIRQLALHLFGPEERAVRAFTSGPPIAIAAVYIERQTLWLWGLTIVSLIVFGLLFRTSLLGLALRSIAIDRDAARLAGIDTARMIGITFGVSAGFSALAGVAIAPLTQTSFDAGAHLGLKGFAAAILGGLANPVSAIVGGLVLGLLETLAAGYIDPLVKDAVALIVLLLVLVVRPGGLFVMKKRDRV